MSRVSCTVTHSEQSVDESEVPLDQQEALGEQASLSEQSEPEPDTVRETGERRRERRRSLRRTDGSPLRQNRHADMSFDRCVSVTKVVAGVASHGGNDDVDATFRVVSNIHLLPIAHRLQHGVMLELKK